MAPLPRLAALAAASALLAGAPATAAPPTCAAGSTARLTIVNGCGADVWVVETPPGTPQQPSTQGQWAWFDAYATQRNTIPIGLGGMQATEDVFTWTAKGVPDPLPVAGAKVQVPGAGPGGATLETSIVKADATSAKLADAAVTAVTGATMMLYDGKVALQLTAGESRTFCVPDKGAPGGNFHFAMGCPANDTQPFSMDGGGCLVGPSAGDVSGSRTLFEPTFGCDPGLSGAACAFNPAGSAAACQATPGPASCPALGSTDFFDVSAVDGYDVPVLLTATPRKGTACSRPTTDASMLDLASCPAENVATLRSTIAAQQDVIAKGVSLLTATPDAMRACVAPYKWFETGTLGTPANPAPSSGACTTIDSACFYAGAGCDNASPVQDCPGGSGPQQRVGPMGNGNFGVQNTAWVQQLFETGYGGYTWQYGDGVGQQTCAWGAELTAHLCPRGGVPYRRLQLWTFDAAAGDCRTDGSTGHGNGTTTFNALVDCQRARMRYTCVDLTPGDPFKVPAAIWQANAAATRSGSGLPWAQVVKRRRLVPQKLTRKIPAGGNGFKGGTLTLPVKNFYYAATTPCPVGHVSPAPHPTAFQARGRVQGVGAGDGAGTLTLVGKLTLPRAVDPAAATVTVWRLLAAARGTEELLRRAGGGAFVPHTLAGTPGRRPNQLGFADPGGDSPALQLDLTGLAPRGGKTRFVLAVDRATIATPPACDAGASAVPLETLFSIHDGTEPPVVVEATLTWLCKGGTLVVRGVGSPPARP